MKLNLITPPAMEPVTVAEVKDWLRVDIGNDDPLITGLIVAARQYAENRTGRAIITQQWDLLLDDLCYDEIRLPKPPCISIDQFDFVDYGGSIDAFTSYIGSVGSPGRIQPDYGTPWPIYRPTIEAIQIRFTCGYGSPSDVPVGINTAIKVLVTHWYENRGDTSVPVPAAVDALLSPFIWEVV